MSESSSQRWSSAVFDLFACVRGRLPASFLERRLADHGLTGVKPLTKDEVPRFEQAVELVGNLIAGRQAPGGLKPDAALAAAFPDGHPTLAGLRPLAIAYVEEMRPSKADKRKAAEAPSEAPTRDDRSRPGRGEARGRPSGDRGANERSQGRSDGARPAPAPRPPRVQWLGWLELHLAPPAAPAIPVAATTDASGATSAPAPSPAATPAPAVWVPPALAQWMIDAEARRNIARIRDRVVAVLADKAEPAAALRELAVALLRPPLGVRDDLRGLIIEYFQQQGLTVPMAALFPPPAVATLKRDWEDLLAKHGPADPTVEAAWKALIDAHPESRAKLEAERSHDLEDLVRRFTQCVRQHGEADKRTADISARLIARHVSGPDRIATELAKIAAIDEAVNCAGQLVATHGWESAEVLAAISTLDPQARQHLESKRRHEFDELDRRVRTASREHGPAAEATVTALARLRERFPTEGAAAAARLERFRRGDDIAQQEKERRDTGRSLSSVHLASAEHRLPHLRAATQWRLVIALNGTRPAAAPAKESKDAKPKGESRPRRDGHAVGWLFTGGCERGPVTAGWRAAESGSLDELDACVQLVVDHDGGVIGLPLSDCPEHQGNAWSDVVRALATLTVVALPTTGPCTIAVELPTWADLSEAQLDDLLTSISIATAAAQRQITLVRAISTDLAASLVDAVALSWHGRKDADSARIRQSGLVGTCLLQPSATLRDAIAQIGNGTIPTWTAWSALLNDAVNEPDGFAPALLAQVRRRISATPEALQGLHRHLTTLARGRIAEPARLARELAWLEESAAPLRPRDRLRLDGAVLAAQAAAGRIEPATVERLTARLAELREEWPAEVLEAALHAAAHAREALDSDTAEALLAPWARAEAVACGGRLLLVRLCEERARIAAGTGRWKDARKHLDRGTETAARSIDHSDRDHALSRLATLRAAVLSDDLSVSDDEALAALAAVIGATEPSAAAATLAVSGAPRHAHHAVLRWAVRRQNETIAEGYFGVRSAWCEIREPTSGIPALRAVLLAPSDPDAARALLDEATTRSDGTAAARLSVLACAVAAALRGAAQPQLGERLAALRRQHVAAAPAVAALERALSLAPDTRAGLAEALPLLAR